MKHLLTAGVLGPATAFLALAGTCLHAVAQPEVENSPGIPPLSPAGPTIPQAPRIVIPLNATPSLEPIWPAAPTAAADLGLSMTGSLIREGSYLSGIRGRLARGQSGRWYFVPDVQANGRALPPMVVIDTGHLDAIERAAAQSAGAATPTRVRLSGRVTVYRDRNYLIPTAPPTVERAVDTSPPSPAPSPSPSTPTPPATSGGGRAGSPDTEPSIEQIINELDRATGPRREPPRPATKAADAGVDAALSGAAESVSTGFLAARRVRLVRAADGALTAVFDSGPEGRTSGPMLLIPCQNLAALETLFDQSQPTATYTMSGEVIASRGRKFLLPTMYVLNRPSTNVLPMQ